MEVVQLKEELETSKGQLARGASVTMGEPSTMPEELAKLKTEIDALQTKG